MNDTQQIRVRDTRKPGHCWQDNELYDVFQPIIGPMATLVYVQMTRECYGHTVEFSLRELGTASGVSKDTAQRALAIMERVGMVRRAERGARGQTRYELVDLKELARHYDGLLDRQRTSYMIPVAQSDRLRAEVRDLLLNYQRKGVVAQSDAGVSVSDATVAQSDSDTRAGSDSVVAQSDATVALEGRPLINKTQEFKTSPSPTPSQREGERFEVLEGGKESVDRVMRECGFSDPGLRLSIELELSAEQGRGPGADSATVATRMIEAWREYSKCGEFLRFNWAPKKFFTQGHWRNPQLWPLDQERLDRARGAAVGSYR